MTIENKTIGQFFSAEMESFNLEVPNDLVPEITSIMKFYDYKYEINVSTNNLITRTKSAGKFSYETVKDFLLAEVFYKKKKNLHFYPISNHHDTVCNFDVSPLDIVKTHPLLKHLLNHQVFYNFIARVHNYGTFIRFSENKVQRLYWNPPLNAGIPLTAKERDPVYELIFMLHDFGHFLLPDLVPSGQTDEISKKFYVCWRLLGESITVVLNEMLVVDYLKDRPEFKELLKLDFDKPYKLFQIFKPLDLRNINDLKKLFHASYKYFCGLESSEFMNLIDRSANNWQEIWTEFDSRYRPVAQRGREWTESNFDAVSAMASDYKKWYKTIKRASAYLNLVWIKDVMPKNINMEFLPENQIMEILFSYVFYSTIYPLFIENASEKIISTRSRKLKTFIRYMLGNVFLLLQHGIEGDIIDKISDMNVSNLDAEINETICFYQSKVLELYEAGKITINEYLNYKNIFIMIPPNILKKDVY